MTAIINGRPELCLDFFTECFVILRSNHTVWLATFNVEENSRIVPAFAPYPGFAPVNPQLRKGSDLGGVFVQHEQSLTDQPLIDAEATVEPSCAVVRQNQDCGVVSQQFEKAAQFLIQILIVVGDHVFIRIAWLVQNVLKIVEFPETV